MKFPQVALVALSCLAHGQSQVPMVRIGTVIDGVTDRKNGLRAAVVNAAQQIMGDQVAVSFPAEKQLAGDWTLQTSSRYIRTLLADEEVDVVLVLGVLGAS
ncbi:MAG: hypothetical protein OXC19_24380 [Bryobacterales bacterium]|nr:hypothetical protein [Bryobacterales bacterium]